MKLILASSLFLCLVQNSLALHPAKPQEYAAIEKRINKVKAATLEIESKREELAQAGDDEERVASISKKIAAREKIRKKAADQALWMTIRAYGILEFAGNDPIYNHGTSVLLSKEKGREISWLPIFDDIGEKDRQDSEGRPDGTHVVEPRIAGNTASDGVSRIFPAAFDSPADLASIIIHEQVHFVQNITPGKGDLKTTAELEVEAYNEELRLATTNELGFPENLRLLQIDRVNGILKVGDSKHPAKEDLAKIERAEADLNRNGIPLPARSLLSHTEEKIRELVAQAKAQVEIAQKEHDRVLRLSWLDYAKRTCADPESVTQDDVDALPAPDKEHYVREMPYPTDPRPCMKVYLYLGGGGRDAEAIRNIARPAPAYKAPEPVRAAPIEALKSFSSIFPRLVTYSIAACNHDPSPDMTDLYQDRYWVGLRETDDRYAFDLVKDLDVCSRNLFWNIIFEIRNADGHFSLDPEWVRRVVLSLPPPKPFSPPVAPPVAPPVNPPDSRPIPPVYNPPPKNDPPCSPENGVMGCPKSTKE